MYDIMFSSVSESIAVTCFDFLTFSLDRALKEDLIKWTLPNKSPLIISAPDHNAHGSY